MRRLTALLAALVFALVLPAGASAQWTLDDKFKAAKPEDLIDVKPTVAPEGAVVLFDGQGVAKWAKRGGGDVKWRLLDGGVMEGVKGHGDIVTKELFATPLKLHVEFRVPYEPAGAGQGRGNSGVYLQGRYELQILDSYGLKSGKNDCAAIYNVASPSVNACKAPTVWQSYDIDFTPPAFDGKAKSKPAAMTVLHNGVKVHDAAPVTTDNTTAGLGGDPATPGPILLQDHGHPVQFRNVWLVVAK